MKFKIQPRPIRRTMVLLITLAMCTLAISMPAHAASLARAKTPKVERSYEWIRLTWKVPKGTKIRYEIRTADGRSKVRTQTVSRASKGKYKGRARVTIKGLTNSTKYSIKYRAIKGKRKSANKTLKATTTTRTPAAFKQRSIRIEPLVDGAKFSWDKTKWAKKYSVAIYPYFGDAPNSLKECQANSGCKLYSTSGSTITLTSAQLSTSTHSVSTSSGNWAYMRLFAQNGSKTRRAGETHFDPVKHQGWLPRPNTFMAQASPVTGESVTVASYNIHIPNDGKNTGNYTWAKRKGHVADSIITSVKSGASVIALQEASHTKKRNGASDSNERQFQELLSEIHARMGNRDLQLVDGAQINDGNWFPGQTWPQDTRIIYDSSRWEATTDPATPFLKTGTKVERDYRPAAWARLTSRSSQKSFCLASIHLNDSSQAIRNSQVATVIKNMNSGRFKSECASKPVVIAGDLNIYQNSRDGSRSRNEVREAFRKTGFHDTKSALVRKNLQYNSTPTGAQLSKSKTPFGLEHLQNGSLIDHILVRDGTGVSAFEVQLPPNKNWSQAGSDHLLIQATFGIG